MKYEVRSIALRTDKAPKLRKQKKRAMAMEKKTAETFGGRRQPRSGGGMFNKGDVKCPSVLFDDKYTDQKSYSLTQKDVAKLCSEAMQERNRNPAFKIRFDSPIEGMEMFPKEWVVIPASFFKELMAAFEKRDE
jgi:hypothetical protein